MYLLTLCRRLYLDDLPRSVWVDWAPRPDPHAAQDSDSGRGNYIFLGALAWIIRHEIAHITCHHVDPVTFDSLTIAAMEQEADRQATKWFVGKREADPDRTLGTHPDEGELELERRAFLMGIGLIWVAMFEASVWQTNTDYPSPALRLFDCLHQIGIREDSAAAQWLAEFIHIWVAPELSWAPGEGYRDSQTFFSEAVFQLQRYLTADARSSPPA
jgi:Peptidase U49